MDTIQKLFSNLVFSKLNISTLEQGLKTLGGKQNELEAIHIYIEIPAHETYRKKKYFHVSRIPNRSWLDSWIYKNMVTDEEDEKYEQYLEKYRPRKQELGYDDIDEYILERHYREKAIKILSSKKRSFDINEWKKPRFYYTYRRKTNIKLKNGSDLQFDFRTHVISLFILTKGDDKHILGIGGDGDSGSRQEYMLFTTIFYLLSKEKPIPHHVIQYDAYNTFHYLATHQVSIITHTLGYSYHLDMDIEKEMRENSIDINDALKDHLKKV